MGAAKHILRYLVGSIAFLDANWGKIPDKGRSMSSYVMIMCNGPVSFKVGMQGFTAQSTMEAELVAAP